MAKFCGKCGAKLDEYTGLCPNCDKEKKAHSRVNSHQTPKFSEERTRSRKELRIEKRAAKKAKKASWSFGKKIIRFLLKFILIVLLVAVLIAGGIGTLVYFDIMNIPMIEEILIKVGLKEMSQDEVSNKGEAISYDDYKVESPNVEEYYQQNSQITAEIDVNDSNDVLTESETVVTLEERGFKDWPITTEYTMEGVYSDATMISDSSSTKHPFYQTYYVTKNGELWTIFVIEGDIMANPVSYNMQSNLGVQVIISESDIITSYDSTTNRFYKTIPNKSALIVKVVEKIDSKTLENLTIGVIDK